MFLLKWILKKSAPAGNALAETNRMVLKKLNMLIVLKWRAVLYIKEQLCFIEESGSNTPIIVSPFL